MFDLRVMSSASKPKEKDVADVIDGTKALTRKQLTKLYLETGDKRFLSRDGARVRKRTPANMRRLPGEEKIKMPAPTPQEKAKRIKLRGEIAKLLGVKRYSGIASLPPAHVGSRWHKVQHRRPVY